MDRVSMVLDIKSIEKGDKRVVCQSELRSCVKREVGWTLIPHPILPPSLVSHTASVDAVKHHGRRKQRFGAPELCEQGGGPGLS